MSDSKEYIIATLAKHSWNLIGIKDSGPPGLINAVRRIRLQAIRHSAFVCVMAVCCRETALRGLRGFKGITTVRP